MKKLYVIFACLPVAHSHAQFHAGQRGLTIKSGMEVSFENLSLRPSSDFTIAENTLQKSETALPGRPTGSINRVYRFARPVNFSGTASISYLTSELNGNTESDLQILYSRDERTENPEFTVTTGSTVDQAVHRVSNVLSDKKPIVISASGPITPLPVTLIRFDVISEGRTAVLNWSASEEINADKFVIERSLDVRHWTEIGQENAIGASRVLQNYSFTDADVPEGINYYRLKMIDNDRSFAYSQIRSLLFSGQDAPFVFPNPVVDKLYLRNVPAKDAVAISVYAISGRLLMEGSIKAGEGVATKGLVPGIYVLKTVLTNGQRNTYTFIK
ncbi:T9SS type A sorting domain-containing protein [Dyadobacter sp. CY323]|uniref:T9SS type A sorting domain-containing protein n=1 Tax=Dyadobacter sp. CY323 TaxID=2907302 RepID=UPI001F1E0965|nr:T9SS type A sorting domain-containing protein [Dyadobacter sp. CY323]MCE6992783.1 T9SS type A sorting domain-containing protein [Dyadobacter sp. CY323]